MKTLLVLATAITFLTGCILAQDSSPPSLSAMVKKGELYQLQTVAPLIDGPDRVTILEFGPKAWVLVEYEASVLLPGELQPRVRKGQMWVNFDQVVAARKVVPEDLTPIAPEPPPPPPALLPSPTPSKTTKPPSKKRK